MKNIIMCDTTLCKREEGVPLPLTFRKKLDIASLLDKLKIQVIELGELAPTTESRLLVKSVASAVNNSVLSVSVGFECKNVDFVWEALKEASHPRLQVCASLSTSRMEYVYHKKAKDMLPIITETVKKCRELCEDVEFCAEDATRADGEFLCTVLSGAIAAGATTVTLCDTSGNMLPEEFGIFLDDTASRVENMNGVSLGVKCSNTLGLADAMAVQAISHGATEIKASATRTDTASLFGIVNILNAKAEYLSVCSEIGTESFAHGMKIIENLCNLSDKGNTPFENGVRETGSSVLFTEKDSFETIGHEIESLGYILSDIDRENIYTAFKRIVSKKRQIDLHELEVIVASECMQVPPAYKLESFVVTTGNAVDTVAHVKLEKGGEMLDGVSLGNGSVDASFLAIEKITGCHYELDDFQIQAITEGKEAMGQTLVKLRSRGKVYSGRGISTDIVSSAVHAYINALNKIVYEEERS